MAVFAPHVGDVVVISVSFYNELRVLTNPTSVTLSITKPDGTVLTPSPTNDSAGRYHYDQAADQSGLWRYVWTGTGAVVAVDPGQYIVRPV
jgi:hypothetical protein